MLVGRWEAIVLRSSSRISFNKKEKKNKNRRYYTFLRDRHYFQFVRVRFVINLSQKSHTRSWSSVPRRVRFYYVHSEQWPFSNRIQVEKIIRTTRKLLEIEFRFNSIRQHFQIIHPNKLFESTELALKEKKSLLKAKARLITPIDRLQFDNNSKFG